MPRKRPHHAGGFTLIEAALTTVIVGVGVLAIVSAQQSYHQKNNWAQRVGSGVLLANELRELTITMPLHDPYTGDYYLGPEPDESASDPATWDDLDDFMVGVGADGYAVARVFDPPINALRQPVADMAGWEQEILLERVFPERISDPFPAPITTDTGMMRVTVTIRHQRQDEPAPVDITRMSWVVAE